MVGCGVDADLVNSAQVHIGNIKAVATKLEADPGNAELKQELSRHVQYYNAVIGSAGDGNASSAEEADFEGMDAEEAKRLKHLMRTTR